MSAKNKNTDELDLELAEDEGEIINETAAEKKNKNKDEKVVGLTKSKLFLIKKLLVNIKDNNDRIMELLADFITSDEEVAISIGQMADEKFTAVPEDETGARIIEGVFDGENMIGPDGKQYSVPANYASKSKLVEGDILKLTITANGTFVYKQIGPIERARIVGVLNHTATGEFFAIAEGRKWRLLTASVTYYKGDSGDEVVILVPKTGESKWAAVENIVKKAQ